MSVCMCVICCCVCKCVSDKCDGLAISKGCIIKKRAEEEGERAPLLLVRSSAFFCSLETHTHTHIQKQRGGGAYMHASIRKEGNVMYTGIFCWVH